jgi:hypothetical protein
MALLKELKVTCQLWNTTHEKEKIVYIFVQVMVGVDIKGTTKEDWDSSQEMIQNGLIQFVYIELVHWLRLDVY